MRLTVEAGYRPSKKQFKKWAEKAEIPEAEVKEEWEDKKDVLNRPRHFQLFRFYSFPSCAYVYYDEPGYIEQRKHYWEMLDLLFEHNKALSELTDKEKDKILDEIESILPRPYGELLEKLERAYEAGMPKSQSPKENYDNREM